MKVLLLNGNTTEAVTMHMVEAVLQHCPPDVQVVGVTAPFGHPYVASRAAVAIAAHAGLETVRAAVEQEEAAGRAPFDVCFYACFGEPGIEAIRAEVAFPVVGMAEGSVLCALQLGERFSIVTVGAAWPAMLRDLLRRTALQERCAGIAVVPGEALSLAGGREDGARAVRGAVAEALTTQAPDVIIVAGAALAGYAQDLAGAFSVPVLDSLTAGFEQTLALGRLRMKARR
ncbi:aspartate/glutamate racemase family protein [Aquabacter sp. CN5-332]|uniref:aspartate/glutamate racemase family protein n=1 Tax=Aquabacter sp. CN5-332 TaxID=3156608 RepID=UPI0032B38E4C